MNSAQLEKTFDQYLDALMEKKGLDKLPEDKKADFKEKSKEMLVNQFNGEVLRSLSDDKLDEFEKAIDEDKSIDELGDIVESAGIDTEKILKGILETFSEIVMEAGTDGAKEEA